MKYMNGNNRHHHHSHHFCFVSSPSPSHHLYLLSFVPPHTVTPSGFSISPPSRRRWQMPEIQKSQHFRLGNLSTVVEKKYLFGLIMKVLCWNEDLSGKVEKTKGTFPVKNRSTKFNPPPNGFFGINYHHWTRGNAFWPFLAPQDAPQGVSRGYGGIGGTKTCNFFRSHIWVQNCEILDCMNCKHFIFQVFKPIRDPLKAKNGLFGLKWLGAKV